MISNSYRWGELGFDYNIKMLSWPDPIGHYLEQKIIIINWLAWIGPNKKNLFSSTDTVILLS